MTPVVDSSQPVDYSSTTTPTSYACTKCGKTGVKLWREYQTFLNHQTLSCVGCGCESQNVDASTVEPDGNRPYEFGYTDQIGWLIPAVPTAENDTFWGYTSVLQDGCDWWSRLPLR